jgi:hypothetical protein
MTHLATSPNSDAQDSEAEAGTGRLDPFVAVVLDELEHRAARRAESCDCLFAGRRELPLCDRCRLSLREDARDEGR